MPRLDRPPPADASRRQRDRVHSCEAPARARSGTLPGRMTPRAARPRGLPTDLDTLPRPDCVRTNAGWRSGRAHGRVASARVRRSNSHRAGATGPGGPATLVAPMAGAGGSRPTGPRPRPEGSSSIQQAIVTGSAAQSSAGPFAGAACARVSRPVMGIDPPDRPYTPPASQWSPSSYRTARISSPVAWPGLFYDSNPVLIACQKLPEERVCRKMCAQPRPPPWCRLPRNCPSPRHFAG